MKLIAGRAVIEFAAVLLIAIALAGCQTQSGSGSSGSADIVLEDFRFTPNRIDAKVGVPLTVQLTNRGTEGHDLNFESLHMPGLGGIEAMLAPEETRAITLTFDQPGVHTFICTLPGHAAAGMTGAAYVTP
jgi:Plastocyanin